MRRYSQTCVKLVRHRGQRAFCVAQFRMHSEQNGWSQPLTNATSFGWMFPWQMAHMTPSSSSPLPSSHPMPSASSARVIACSVGVFGRGGKTSREVSSAGADAASRPIGPLPQLPPISSSG